MNSQAKRPSPLPSASARLARSACAAMCLALAGLRPGAAQATVYDICTGVPTGGVYLFEHANYSGRCVFKGPGSYINSWGTELPNDSISSVMVGPGAQVHLCTDSHFGGICDLYTSSEPRLSKTIVGNDRVSSAEVQYAGEARRPSTCVPRSGEVAVYSDTYFGGSCALLRISGYSAFSPSARLSLPNDSISSFRTGGGISSVRLCADVDFGGRCATFTRQRWDLSRDITRLSPFDLNDRTSSLDAYQATRF